MENLFAKTLNKKKQKVITDFIIYYKSEKIRVKYTAYWSHIFLENNEEFIMDHFEFYSKVTSNTHYRSEFISRKDMKGLGYKEVALEMIKELAKNYEPKLL